MEEPPRQRFQVSLRTLLEIIAVVAVALTLLYLRTPPAVPAPAAGRYQLTREPGSGDFQFLLFDTATGKAWRKSGAGEWHKLKPPQEPLAP